MLSTQITATHAPSIQSDNSLTNKSSSSRSPANICIITPAGSQITDDDDHNYTTLPRTTSAIDSVVNEFMSIRSSSNTTEITTPSEVDQGHDDDISHIKGLSADKTSTVTAATTSTTTTNTTAISTLRPASLLPSLSLLYPDTAPRSAWRPQVNSWLKKNQPSKLREISELFADLRSTDNDDSHHHHHHHHHIIQHQQGSHNHNHNHHNHHNRIDDVSQHKTYASSLSSAIGPRKERRLSHEKPYSRNPALKSHNSSFNTTICSVEPPSPPLSPPANDHSSRRKCISCGSDQSPCWRPSWSTTAGQLCNSCGLRYKKTGARCLSSSCLRIPAKGEWTIMKNAAFMVNDKLIYTCLMCGGEVEVGERG